MADTNGSSGSDRLGPIERIIEGMARRQAEMQNTQAEMQNTIAEMQDIEASMQQDIKMLVRSQVVMGDALTTLIKAQERTDETLQRTDEALQRLEESQRRSEESHRSLEQAQKRTEENLNALILIVDEVIRGRKRDS